jgi:hypothetical protein
MLDYIKVKKKIKSKAIPVTGRGGLLGCMMLRIKDNRLTDGGKQPYAPAAVLLPGNIVFMLLVLIFV